MQQMSRGDFDQLIENARLLEKDGRGPKVYETPDGRIVKLFRVKRRFSSNLWSPLARRFAKNAGALTERGVVAPEILHVGKVPHLDRQMVIYRKLEGTPLRHFFRNASPEEAAATAQHAGAFVNDVQNRGVLFRSFHFGNILVQDQGFALIDVLDSRLKGRPLNLKERERNFKHLTRYEEDRAALAKYWEEFAEGYLLEKPQGVERDAMVKLLAAQQVSLASQQS